MFKRRSFWIILLIALLAAGVAAAMLKKQKQAAANALPVAAQAPAVMEFLVSDVMQVKAQDLRRLMPLTGSLRAVNQVSVKARVAGEVREVLVREGEAVKAGQVLIRMDQSDYKRQFSTLNGLYMPSPLG